MADRQQSKIQNLKSKICSQLGSKDWRMFGSRGRQLALHHDQLACDEGCLGEPVVPSLGEQFLCAAGLLETPDREMGLKGALLSCKSALDQFLIESGCETRYFVDISTEPDPEHPRIPRVREDANSFQTK